MSWSFLELYALWNGNEQENSVALAVEFEKIKKLIYILL